MSKKMAKKWVVIWRNPVKNELFRLLDFEKCLKMANFSRGYPANFQVSGKSSFCKMLKIKLVYFSNFFNHQIEPILKFFLSEKNVGAIFWFLEKNRFFGFGENPKNGEFLHFRQNRKSAKKSPKIGKKSWVGGIFHFARFWGPNISGALAWKKLKFFVRKI